MSVVPDRRGGLRFAVEACNPNIKTHSAEIEIALVSRGDDSDLCPVGVRFGVDGDWAWALSHPPSNPSSQSEGPPVLKQQESVRAGAKSHVPAGAALYAASLKEGDISLLPETLCLLVATKNLGALRRVPFVPGNLLPLAEACVGGMADGQGGAAVAALAMALAEVCCLESKDTCLHQCHHSPDALPLL